jgi:hypothetical protein
VTSEPAYSLEWSPYSSRDSGSNQVAKRRSRRRIIKPQELKDWIDVLRVAIEKSSGHSSMGFAVSSTLQ